MTSPLPALKTASFLYHFMASKLESPVQTQMAVSAFNSISNGQYHENGILKPVRTRRVFVQTETGCVLGLECRLPLTYLQMRAL